MAFVKTGPTIRFSQVCWQKMWALVHACDIEISWMMLTATEEEREAAGVTESYYFTDVYVVDQECDGTNTDMVETAVGDLCNELLNNDIDPSRLKGYGHSHPTFSTDPSQKDEKTFERLELEPLVSIILNKMGEVYLRMDQWEPFRHSFKCNYVVDQIQLIPDGWGKEMVNAHVTKLKPKYKYAGVKKGQSGYYSWNGSWSDDDWRGSSLGKAKKDKKDTTADTAVATEEADVVDHFDEYEKDYEIVKSLELPQELALLESYFLSSDIDINELLMLHAEWYAKELSTEELEEQLYQIDIKGATTEEDEEEVIDFDPAFYASENPTQEELKALGMAEA